MNNYKNMIMSHTRNIQHFYFPDKFVYHIPIYSEVDILKYKPIKRAQYEIAHNNLILTCYLQNFPIIRIPDVETAETHDVLR